MLRLAFHLIETPLTYVGTNDNVVIHVKELPNNRYLIDDGGNADWFASTAGYDFKSTSTDFFIKSHESLLGVKINENGEVYTISDGEDAVSLSILRVAQCFRFSFCTQRLFCANRNPKAHSKKIYEMPFFL